jgi:hypothetical protein
MEEGKITEKMSRRLVLITSSFAAVLAVYTIAFSIIAGMADKDCRARGYPYGQATWIFGGQCHGKQITTGEKNEREDSVLPAVQAGSHANSGTH